jgi:hypothetical protein
MNINDAEHDALMKQFEQDYPYARTDKEPKRLWPLQHVYCHPDTNKDFLAYRMGYSLGRVIERNGGW